MSFAASILQVNDVHAAEFFFREVFGFTRVRDVRNQMLELHGNNSGISLYLMDSTVLPNQVLGGSVMIPTTSLIALTALAQKHHATYNWICNGNAILLEGPSNISVISFNSDSVGRNNEKVNLMDVMEEFHNLTSLPQDQQALSTVCTPTKTLGTDSPYTSACGMISPEGELFSHISQPVPISPVRSSTQLPSRLLPPPPHIDNFVLHVSTNTFSSIPLKEGGDDNIGSLNGEACHTSLKPFQPNCRQAIPFENNFFVGQILFVVRTKPLDPFYKHFFEHSKDRMYIIQLQGRFKKPPRNASSLFMGAESVGPTSMGMMTKGICRAMLKFGNAKLKGKNSIRHSFGGGNSSVRRESQWGRSSFSTDNRPSDDPMPCFAEDVREDIAYASVPLLTAADRFCVTPGDVKPPDIQQEFHEAPNSRSRRRNKPDSIVFDDSSTYSFTFKGRNIDFCEWSTCGFYMIKSVSLNSFLGASSAMRLVAYCLEQPTSTMYSSAPSTSNAETDQSLEAAAAHSKSKIVYLLEVNVTASSSQIMVSNDEDADRYDYEDEEEEDNRSDVESDTEEIATVERATIPSPDVLAKFEESLDAEIPAIPPRPVSRLSESDLRSSPLSMVLPMGSRTGTHDINWTHSDMQYCMAALEIDDYRRGRRRRVAYMVTAPGHPVRLRSYMQLAAVIPMIMMAEDGSEKRLPESELRRRQIAKSMKRVEKQSHSNSKVAQILKKLLTDENELDHYFLKKSAAAALKSGASPEDRADIRSRRSLFSPSNLDSALDNFSSSIATQSGNRNSIRFTALRDTTNNVNSTDTLSSFSVDMKGVRMEGAVAVCTGRRSWSEEWAVLNGRYFEIFMPQMPSHLRPPTRISISQIKSVSTLPKDLKPFEGGYEFFAIGTAARVFYFCVKNQEMLNQWMDALLIFQRPPTSVLEESQGDDFASSILPAAYPALGEDILTDSDEPEACIVHPGNFVPATPSVLNMRRVVFYATHGGRLEPEAAISPVQLSQELLRKIVRLSNPNNVQLEGSVVDSHPSTFEWTEFSDQVCLLQTVCLVDLTRDELTAFFLNIYHTLLTHAFIVYGVPGRPIVWRSFKRKAAYEIAGDVMSLRDIDEIVLGNSCNQVVLLNILRINITYADAVKQCESSRHYWLNNGIIFPSACMFMGRMVNSKIISCLLSSQSNPQCVMLNNGVVSMENIDWRLALCVCTGCTAVSNEIVLFDGDKIDAQLDSRCKALLFRQIKIDLSSPTFLNSANPSITMPLALSSLLLVSHSKTMRLMPSPLLQTTSPDDPLFWVCSMEYFLSSALATFSKLDRTGEKHDLPGEESLAVNKQRTVSKAELSIIEKLKSLAKAKKESENVKVHIFFNSPGYNSFRFLKLTTDAYVDLERASGECDLASFTSTWKSADRINAKGRYAPVTTPERDNLRNQLQLSTPPGEAIPRSQSLDSNDHVVPPVGLDSIVECDEHIVSNKDIAQRSNKCQLDGSHAPTEVSKKGGVKQPVKRGSFFKIFGKNKA